MNTLRNSKEGEKKQKLLDAIGCLLYVLAVLVIGAVIFANWEKFVP